MDWERRGPGQGQEQGLGNTAPMNGDEPVYVVPAGGIQPRGPSPDHDAGEPRLGIWDDPLPIDERYTKPLPPGYVPPALPKKLPRAPGAAGAKPWMVVVSVLVVMGLLAGLVFAVLHAQGGASTAGPKDPCGGGGACNSANAYLRAYASGKYEAMYALTSQASQQRFSDAAILNNVWSDAHDYIVNRTVGILKEAGVSVIDATPGRAVQNKDGTVSVPVHLVLQSVKVGPINQDIKIPLVNEKGQWHVTWSPGLIFPQLDDPNDPTYRRAIHFVADDVQRGKILDRDGNILAEDDTVYRIAVAPGQITNEAALLATLSTKLGMSADTIKAKYQPTSNTWDDGCKCALIRIVPPQLYFTMQGTLGGLPGVKVFQGTGRIYPFGADMAAITGYTSVVTAEDVKADPKYYGGTETEVGHAGVEQWAEQYLRPTRGGKLLIVNRNADGSLNLSTPVYFIAQRPGLNGADVHTTIALALQQTAMQTLRAKANGYAGGAFAVDPATGEVLVMASNPIYDPNDFSLNFQEGIAQIQQSNLHPQLNCAIQCADPTGSIFKIVTLAAGLQHGVKPSDIFTCTGSYQVPGENHLRIDDAPQGHGSLTAPDALGPSCDSIYWQLAVRLNSQDPTWLPSAAKAFGYGAVPNIVGVPQGVENAGVVPDPQWLQQNKGAGWSPTDAANLGIGQGFFTASPAQVALVSAALANGGNRMQPRLVSNITDAGGAVVKAFAATQVGSVGLTSDGLATMQVAMLGSAMSPKGTSYDTFHDLPLTIGAKTGTAESGQSHPHSWFTAYAPAAQVGAPPTQAKIAIGALVEYSDLGDAYAAPVVKAILKAEFNV